MMSCYGRLNFKYWVNDAASNQEPLVKEILSEEASYRIVMENNGRDHKSSFEMHINKNVVEVAAPKDNESDVIDNAKVIVKKSAR
ncbi:hypothetical protein Tco_0336132 [Tanacetum coccineum]